MNNMETISCPFCDENTFEKLFKAEDIIGGVEGEFQVVRCVECGMMMTNPRPNVKEIEKFYPDSYHCYNFNTKKVNRSIVLRNKFPVIYRAIDVSGLTYAKVKSNADVLEIGCGAGEFLYVYTKMNPQQKVQGIEFDAESVKFLKKQGLSVKQSNLNDGINISSNSQDMVIGWMILEHLHNINFVLGEVHNSLRSGGKFVFSIPNAGSWQFNFFKNNWYALQTPQHLYHFTEESISKLLKKNGFEVEKVYHQRIFSDIVNSGRFMIRDKMSENIVRNMLERLFIWNIVYFVITFPVAILLSFAKQSGRFTIVAKKI